MDIKPDLTTGRLPQRGLIIALLMAGQKAPQIIPTCNEFGYHCTEGDVIQIFSALTASASKNIQETLTSGQPLRVDDKTHAEWMRHYGVFELLDFMKNKAAEDPPEYFKWIKDALWINVTDEAQSITNILLFNEDTPESVAAVLKFKYRKQISVDAVELHQRLFFNTIGLGADDIMRRCTGLQKSAFVIERIAGDETDKKPNEAALSHINRKAVFHDNTYIKWKIGYPDIQPPRAEDFLNRVMLDASNRYYEASMMTQFADTKEETGVSAVTGQAYDNLVTQRKNAAKEQAKLLASYTNLYIKALNAKPSSNSSAAQAVIDKLSQLELQFDEVKEEIAPLSSLPAEAMQDIAAARSIGGDGAGIGQ